MSGFNPALFFYDREQRAEPALLTVTLDDGKCERVVIFRHIVDFTCAMGAHAL
jgi:hypothetical protein